MTKESALEWLKSMYKGELNRAHQENLAGHEVSGGVHVCKATAINIAIDALSCACKPENSPSDERTTDKGMFIPSAPNEAETGDFSAKEALAEIGKAFVKFGEAIDKAVEK